jgi:hypothetical protein
MDTIINDDIREVWNKKLITFPASLGCPWISVLFKLESGTYIINVL